MDSENTCHGGVCSSAAQVYQLGSPCVAQQTREKTLSEDSSKLWIPGYPRRKHIVAWASAYQQQGPKTIMRHDVAQKAQMTHSVASDLSPKMLPSRASSDMEKAHHCYNTSLVKASGLLVTTKFAVGNTAPYFEHAAQPTFDLAEVVCCMTSWQGVAGTLFLSRKLTLPPEKFLRGAQVGRPPIPTPGLFLQFSGPKLPVPKGPIML